SVLTLILAAALLPAGLAAQAPAAPPVPLFAPTVIQPLRVANAGSENPFAGMLSRLHRDPATTSQAPAETAAAPSMFPRYELFLGYSNLRSFPGLRADNRLVW